MKKLLIIFTFLFCCFAGLKLSVDAYMQKEVGVSSSTIIEIKKGSNLTFLANELQKKGIIQYPRLFVKIGQFYGYANRLKYGEYEIIPESTYFDLFEKLVSGDNYRYPITLIEGDHIYSLANQLEKRGLVSKQTFLNYIKNGKITLELLGMKVDSLEGYLFPDTYHFSKADNVHTISKAMVDRFKEETKKLNLEQHGLNQHQVVTLASIIEKETGAGFERPLISSVFHNRLKKKMRLQTDPTIIYGIMNETGKEIKNIRKKDIKRPTAYNTYTINGLPPGPIGNPGIEAIKAAINPQNTNFLYFVSQNDGTHVFTTNYKDHLKAVKKYQLNSKAREGKSWRDLNKKRVK